MQQITDPRCQRKDLAAKAEAAARQTAAVGFPIERWVSLHAQAIDEESPIEAITRRMGLATTAELVTVLRGALREGFLPESIPDDLPAEDAYRRFYSLALILVVAERELEVAA